MIFANSNSAGHNNKKKKQHLQQSTNTHLLHHKYLNGDSDYGLHLTHKHSSPGSKSGVVNYLKSDYNTNLLEIEDEYLSKIIEHDQGNDYFISMENNQREKISNERKDSGYIPLRYFYEIMKPFEDKVQTLLQQLCTHTLVNNEEFQLIISSLPHHLSLQKLHQENMIFSSKFYKRQIRIFQALLQTLVECEKFYGVSSTNESANQQPRGNQLESRNKILNLLDDIIPYLNVIYSGALKGIQKSQKGGNKNIINLRQSDLFQEEFAKSMSDVSFISESIILFLRMWMGMANTDLNQFIVVSNSTVLDMAIVKANLQEFIEIHRESAREQYIVSSLNDPESNIFIKLSKQSLLPFHVENQEQKYNEQNSLMNQQMQQMQQQTDPSVYQNIPLDYIFASYQNGYNNTNLNEIDIQLQNQQLLMNRMMRNYMDDENMEIEMSSLTSEKLFDSVRENLIQLYNLDENSEIFYFDENYSQVNTIMEFEKTRLIKIIINKQQHNQQLILAHNLNIDASLVVIPPEMLLQQRPIIIGISGSTRSGKGTLCGHLQILYGAKYICQDSYFNYPLIQSTLQGNAECKEAILWDQFLVDIQKVIQENQYKMLILDGFQLFNHPTLVDICDVQIFLDIPDEQIYSRRMGTKPVKESYFWKCIMQEYSLYRQNCLQNNKITSMQASQDQFTLYFLTLQLIQLKINPPSSNPNIILP